MRFEKFKIAFIALSLIVFGALSLPEFEFEVSGETVRYPSIGFSRIGIPEDYGSFKRGNGIFSTTNVDAEIVIDDIFADPKLEAKNVLSTVQERLDFIGLHDVAATLIEKNITPTEDEISEEGDEDSVVLNEIQTSYGYFIRFSFPEYFSNPQNVASWLIAKGEVVIDDEFDGATPVLTEDDITGGLSIETSIPLQSGQNTFQYITEENLSLEFANNLAAINTLTNSENGAFIVVDGIPAYQLISDSREDDVLRGLPLEGSTLAERLLYMQITRTYVLLDEFSIDHDVTVEQDSVVAVPPEFNVDGGSIIAVTFIIGATLLSVIFLRRFKVKGFVTHGLLLSIEMLGFVTLLKFFQANLSLGFIFGFIAVYALFELINLALITGTEEIDVYRKRLIILALVILAVSASIFRIGSNLGDVQDALGVFIAFSLMLLVMTQFYFKTIIMLVEKRLS